MKRVDSVISLIYSLSKSEKKHFSLQVIKDKEEKDYLVIYDIIIKSKQPNGNTVKEEFYRRKPNGSFEVSIQYLYEKLTDTLLTLRKKKDIYYDLLNNLCKARMLYERSLFEECFEILSNTIEHWPTRHIRPHGQLQRNSDDSFEAGTGISAPSELSQHDRTGAFSQTLHPK